MLVYILLLYIFLLDNQQWLQVEEVILNGSQYKKEIRRIII